MQGDVPVEDPAGLDREVVVVLAEVGDVHLDLPRRHAAPRGPHVVLALVDLQAVRQRRRRGRRRRSGRRDVGRRGPRGPGRRGGGNDGGGGGGGGPGGARGHPRGGGPG